jgi:hypothetical protein
MEMAKCPGIALLDIGASSIFISESAVAAANLSTYPCNMNVILADNKTLNITKMTCFKLKTAKRITTEVHAFVLPKLVNDVDMVLATKWLEANNVIIDYHKKTVHIKTRKWGKVNLKLLCLMLGL